MMSLSVSLIPSFIALLLLCQCSITVVSFNLDMKNARLYNGPENSDFGYSVALTMKTVKGDGLVVGAPRADLSPHFTFNNISKSGVVYGCDFRSQKCEEFAIPISTRISLPNPENVKERRSGQKLGASVAATRDGTVAACAPLYVTYGPRMNKREPVGDCWVSERAGTLFKRVSPCLTEFTKFYNIQYKDPKDDLGWASYHKTGHGMCGFSLTLGPHDELGIGAPGNHYFQGQFYSVPAMRNYATDASKTDKGSDLDDNTYTSWDTKYGEFDGDTATVDAATSAPRASLLRGKVLVWTEDRDSKQFTSIFNFTGDQAGAYFGYSLAVGRFDEHVSAAGGMDDIAVGAPLYADYKQDMPELGQVAVYSQKRIGSGREFKLSISITGKDPHGRFGQSLVNAGDINMDGYDDLLVGAPYGGPDRRGVVYLYHGSQTGLSKTPIQVIHSETIRKSPPLLTFGWSLAGRMDIDNNKYDDVAIGAYKSSAAVILRSRPVITLQCTLTTQRKHIQLPVPCSKDYEKSSKTVLELNVKVCIGYDAPSDPGEITLNALLKFDSANNNTKRAFGLITGQSNVLISLPLKSKERECRVVKGYLQNNIRDKTSPLNISIDIELAGFHPYPSVTPDPILNQLVAPAQPIQIEFLKSCNACTPDLDIAVTTPALFYILGAEDKIDMVVTLANRGEDSYETVLTLDLPDGVSYVNPVLEDNECIPIACQQVLVNQTGSYRVTCDVGNPFPSVHSTSFKLVMRLEDIHSIDETELLFAFKVGSNYADDINPANNQYNVTIPLKVKTNIHVTGNSNPADAIAYNDTHIKTRRGPQVEHKYEIYTTAPSVISSGHLTITWPLFTKDLNDYFLYIYDAPEVLQGDARCYLSQRYVDPRNVTGIGKRLSVNVGKRERRAATPENHLACNNKLVSCINIECTLGRLSKNESIIIKIRSFLWMSPSFKNLTEGYTKDAVISTAAKATITGVPYAIKPVSFSTASFEIMSYFEKYRPPKVRKPLDWKWIAIGIGCGLLLLIIIIIILWRCGFFKRYRPYAEAKVEKHKDGQPHECEQLYSSSYQ